MLPLAVHRDGFSCLCQLPNDLETSLKFRTGLPFLRGPYSELFDFIANNDSLICLFRFTLKVPLRNTLIFLCFLSHLFSKEFKDRKEGVHLIHFLSSSTAPSPVREVYTTANHHRASDGDKGYLQWEPSCRPTQVCSSYVDVQVLRPQSAKRTARFPQHCPVTKIKKHLQTRLMGKAPCQEQWRKTHTCAHTHTSTYAHTPPRLSPQRRNCRLICRGRISSLEEGRHLLKSLYFYFSCTLKFQIRYLAQAKKHYSKCRGNKHICVIKTTQTQKKEKLNPSWGSRNTPPGKSDLTAFKCQGASRLQKQQEQRYRSLWSGGTWRRQWSTAKEAKWKSLRRWNFNLSEMQLEGSGRVHSGITHLAFPVDGPGGAGSRPAQNNSCASGIGMSVPNNRSDTPISHRWVGREGQRWQQASYSECLRGWGSRARQENVLCIAQEMVRSVWATLSLECLWDNLHLTSDKMWCYKS